MAIISESFRNPKSDRYRGLKELAKSLWLDDPSEKKEYRGRSRSRGKDEDVDVFWDQRPKLEDMPKTLKTSRSMHNLVNKLEASTLEKPQSKPAKSKRVLIFTGLPSCTGISSIISQVCCGPLEKIVATSDRLELYYIFPEHAKEFHDYVNNTGLFRVNGNRLQMEWANKANTDDSLAPIPKLLLKEVTYGSARRILIFSKIVPQKTLRDPSAMHYPTARTHLSKDLDIELIKSDFSQFGQIIEFGSVISRKLCFSIHFHDVRSAIAAKNEVETPGSMLNVKYLGWSLWYGKDPTDKACFVL